jgi:hypothetical protein
VLERLPGDVHRTCAVRRVPNTTSPAANGRRGATGTRMPTPQPEWGGCPPLTGCFSAPAWRRFVSPLQAAADAGVRPSGSDTMAPALCLSAVSGSTTLLPLRRKRSQRASWILGHLALLPGAGRLHVNGGWAHPRPVAANDRLLWSRREGGGDRRRAEARRISAISVNETWNGPANDPHRVETRSSVSLTRHLPQQARRIEVLGQIPFAGHCCLDTGARSAALTAPATPQRTHALLRHTAD